MLFEPVFSLFRYFSSYGVKLVALIQAIRVIQLDRKMKRMSYYPSLAWRYVDSDGRFSLVQVLYLKTRPDLLSFREETSGSFSSSRYQPIPQKVGCRADGSGFSRHVPLPTTGG